MSLPPYKHKRNPALEKEDEPSYESSVAPLIIHTSVVEKRRTTDPKFIRTQTELPGIDFEFTPMSSITCTDYRCPHYISRKTTRKENRNQHSTNQINSKPETRGVLKQQNIEDPEKVSKMIDDDNDDARTTYSRKSNVSHQSHRSARSTSSRGIECEERSVPNQAMYKEHRTITGASGDLGSGDINIKEERKSHKRECSMGGDNDKSDDAKSHLSNTAHGNKLTEEDRASEKSARSTKSQKSTTSRSSFPSTINEVLGASCNGRQRYQLFRQPANGLDYCDQLYSKWR